jgi:hypothetical protein
MSPADRCNAEQDHSDPKHDHPNRPWYAKGRHCGGGEGNGKPRNTLGLELASLSHSERHTGNVMKRWMASLAWS